MIARSDGAIRNKPLSTFQHHIPVSAKLAI